jgi:SAM-dependent methyltransferase
MVNVTASARQKGPWQNHFITHHFVIADLRRCLRAMFYLDYLRKNLLLTLQLMRRGEWGRIGRALHARFYLALHWALFFLKAPWLRAQAPPLPVSQVEVLTAHPVAIASPDHLAPHGTKYNNSTNRKFVTLMNAYFRRQFPKEPPAMLDLGCSGGQLVADFARLRWLAVGLEGSDYSHKRRRANWAALAGKNLFTCDISKPFRVRLDGQDLKFHLITAWEVLEHLHPNDLDTLFNNLRAHLATGGYFIATTNSSPSIVDGIELHQTRMSNAQWRAYIAQRHPDMEPADLGLKIYQYVRFDFGEPSFLVYRNKGSSSD